MSVRHPRVIEWERRLSRVFDEIDDVLEDKYAGKYPLHPARARRGLTSSKAHDGLFNVGAVFSAGYGSRRGPGYIVRIRTATLSDVPAQVRDEINAEVERLLKEKLAEAFPERILRITRDGPAIKIYGDLSLGHA